MELGRDDVESQGDGIDPLRRRQAGIHGVVARIAIERTAVDGAVADVVLRAAGSVMVQPAGVGAHGDHNLGVQIDLVERTRHRPFFFGLADPLGNLFGHLFLLGGGLGLLVGLLLLHGLLLLLLLSLLLHGLLLILLIGLLLHRLLLLLVLLLRLSDGRLSVVIVIAAADQRQASRANARPGRSPQQRPPTQLSSLHPLPIVSVAHSNTFHQARPGASSLWSCEVCQPRFAIATLVRGPLRG